MTTSELNDPMSSTEFEDTVSAITDRLWSDKCPACGRYVGRDKGYYMPIPPAETLDEPGVELGLYCNDACGERAEAAFTNKTRRGTRTTP